MPVMRGDELTLPMAGTARVPNVPQSIARSKTNSHRYSWRAGSRETTCEGRSAEPVAISGRSALVELHVTVEVIPPAVGGIFETDGDPDGRRTLRTLRHPDQVHARFSWGAPALPAVARHTASHDVLPVFPAALGDRHDMVEREIRRGKDVAAILTGVIVPCVDVRARKRHVIDIPLDFDVSQQANDRGQLEAEGRRPYFAFVRRNNLD